MLLHRPRLLRRVICIFNYYPNSVIVRLQVLAWIGLAFTPSTTVKETGCWANLKCVPAWVPDIGDEVPDYDRIV